MQYYLTDRPLPFPSIAIGTDSGVRIEGWAQQSPDVPLKVSTQDQREGPILRHSSDGLSRTNQARTCGEYRPDKMVVWAFVMLSTDRL